MRIKLKSGEDIRLNETEGHEYIPINDTGLITIYDHEDCGSEWCPINTRLYSFPLRDILLIEYEANND